MKIILFRHGEKQKTESKIADDKNGVELTNLGINQITKLGNTLKQRFPQLNNSNTIYSSLYHRSIQSAEIVQKTLNIKNLVSLSEFGEFNAYNNYLNPKEIREHIQAFALQNPDWIPLKPIFLLTRLYLVSKLKSDNFVNKLQLNIF